MRGAAAAAAAEVEVATPSPVSGGAPGARAAHSAIATIIDCTDNKEWRCCAMSEAMDEKAIARWLTLRLAGDRGREDWRRFLEASWKHITAQKLGAILPPPEVK